MQYEVLQEMARRGYRYMDLTRANVPELSSFMTLLNPMLVLYYMVERLSRPYRSVN